MKNNKEIIRDKRIAKAITELSYVWDESNLDDEQQGLLYLSITSLQHLQEDLRRKQR